MIDPKQDEIAAQPFPHEILPSGGYWPMIEEPQEVERMVAYRAGTVPGAAAGCLGFPKGL